MLVVCYERSSRIYVAEKSSRKIPNFFDEIKDKERRLSDAFLITIYE